MIGRANPIIREVCFGATRRRMAALELSTGASAPPGQSRRGEEPERGVGEDGQGRTPSNRTLHARQRRSVGADRGVAVAAEQDRIVPRLGSPGAAGPAVGRTGLVRTLSLNVIVVGRGRRGVVPVAAFVTSPGEVCGLPAAPPLPTGRPDARPRYKDGQVEGSA